MDEGNAVRRSDDEPAAGSPAARVGTQIRGKWRLDALLGTGGMASVYAATHTNGRRAALKILHRALSADEGIRERFVREGYLGNKIPHPGRVECLDNDECEDGSPFLVLELLEGETLEALWRREDKRLATPVALGIADQLLDCLVACHAAGVVHRDIKPANVFVTRDGRVKVLDFGVAQLREDDVQHTRAGLTLGTPSFMAPEQARGAGDELDGRADIFSVGALLYALLSGRRLHQGRTSDEALILAATQPAPSLAQVAPQLPVEAVALVDKALAWDRRNRFATASEMQAAVRDLLSRSQPPAAPDTLETARRTLAETLRPSPPVDLADDHPEIQRLRALLRQVERALPAIRQYGWSHPEAERRVRGAFDELLGALAAAPDAIAWTVRPYAFVHRGREVWEPAAPLDGVPYALFDGGVRTMRVLPGIRETELRALLSLFLIDPRTDLPPGDDLGTALWDLGLAHVDVEMADAFAEGDADARERFFEQSEEVEELARSAAAAASRVEARAMSIATGAGFAGRSRIAALDATARIALATQLDLGEGKWRERFADALVEALVEAIRAGDIAGLATGLRTSSSRWLVSGHAAAARALYTETAALAARRLSPKDATSVQWALANAMFGGAALEHVVRHGTADAGSVAFAVTAIGQLAATSFGEALATLRGCDDGPVSAALLSLVERNAQGAELAIARAVPEVRAPHGRELVQILARLGTMTARAALRGLASLPDAELRVEAIASSAPPDRLRAELLALADDAEPAVRIAALRAMAARGLKEAGPELVRRIEDPSFHSFGLEEREGLLEALHAVNPTRAEAAAISLLSQHGLTGDTERASTRLLAARHLGAHGDSDGARGALEDATKKWWWNSDELRSVASQALAARRGTPS